MLRSLFPCVGSVTGTTGSWAPPNGRGKTGTSEYIKHPSLYQPHLQARWFVTSETHFWDLGPPRLVGATWVSLTRLKFRNGMLGWDARWIALPPGPNYPQYLTTPSVAHCVRWCWGSLVPLLGFSNGRAKLNIKKINPAKE